MATIVEQLSFHEFKIRALHASSPIPTTDRSSRQSSPEYHRFADTKNFAEATNLLENGWTEGREFVGKIVNDINYSTLPVPKRRVIRDVEGDYVDVAEYIKGTPECMFAYQKRPSPKRIAKILFEIGASSAISTEKMRWKGAIVLALIDKLEASGIRAELDISYTMSDLVNHKTNIWAIMIRVKEADEQVNIDKLAFLLAHPSSFRRMIFSVMETHPDENVRKTFGAGSFYGIPQTNIKPIIESIPELNQTPYDLIVPGMQLTDLEKALQMVNDLFNQLTLN